MTTAVVDGDKEGVVDVDSDGDVPEKNNEGIVIILDRFHTTLR